MTTKPSLEEQIAMAGLKYCRRHDILYRSGLAIQVLGAAVLAILYPLQNAFYTAGIMLFELGVLLSALYLLVWMRPIKICIVCTVISGLIIQTTAYFYGPEQYVGTLLLVGIGLVCAGAAGMAGKEAYYCGYWEGWLLATIILPGMVLANLIGNHDVIFNSLGFSVAFLLVLSLTGKKFKQKVLFTLDERVKIKVRQ